MVRTVLHLDHVCKSFYDPGRGEVKAVDDLHLVVEPGVLALVGANGAGKSTLLRLIATLLTPDAGRIRLGDLDTRTHPDAVRAKLGYMSTTTRLYPRFTPHELLRHVAGFLPFDAATKRERIAAVIAQFNLGDILNQRIQGLSTGQLQRANLARTLLADPDLLVLDEPTTGLDLVAADQLVAAVRAAKRPGRLILMATHVMREVDLLADQLLVLARGRAVFYGPPADLGTGEQLTAGVLRLLVPVPVVTP